jgi:hypothetical protein
MKTIVKHWISIAWVVSMILLGLAFWEIQGLNRENESNINEIHRLANAASKQAQANCKRDNVLRESYFQSLENARFGAIKRGQINLAEKIYKEQQTIVKAFSSTANPTGSVTVDCSTVFAYSFDDESE